MPCGGGAMHFGLLGSELLPLRVARGIFLCGLNISLFIAAGNKVQLFVSTLLCIPLILSAEPWTGISWVLLRSLNSSLLFLSALKEWNGQTIKCAVRSSGHSYVQTSLHMISLREHGEMSRTCLRHWNLSIWQADFITLKILLRNAIKKKWQP